MNIARTNGTITSRVEMSAAARVTVAMLISEPTASQVCWVRISVFLTEFDIRGEGAILGCHRKANTYAGCLPESLSISSFPCSGWERNGPDPPHREALKSRRF